MIQHKDWLRSQAHRVSHDRWWYGHKEKFAAGTRKHRGNQAGDDGLRGGFRSI
jgi:hypothetical protein